MFKRVYKVLGFSVVIMGVLTGCGSQAPTHTTDQTTANSETPTSNQTTTTIVGEPETQGVEGAEANAVSALPDLEIRLGYEGEPYTLRLYDNDTAAAIARHVGSADWNLPIYNYDDFENYEVMQYYDIPSRYDIPSSPERITSQVIGEVYYSAPNRIVLFYQDAEVTGDYTPVGYLTDTTGLTEAVDRKSVV